MATKYARIIQQLMLFCLVSSCSSEKSSILRVEPPYCLRESTLPKYCVVEPPLGSYVPIPHIPSKDADLILFALNPEYLEAELFLHGAYGVGLEAFDPTLVGGGLPPIGARKANLDPFILDITKQLGLQEVGHIRAIKQTIPYAFPRVLLNLSGEVFNMAMEEALGRKLMPPFDPYANTINWLLGIYLVPYIGQLLVAGLLAVEAGQDVQIRTLLYIHKDKILYNMTIAEITNKLSELRKMLGRTLVVDEGLVVPRCLGAEGKISGNTICADPNSIAYARTPKQILGIVYTSGDASKPGGFYPEGANGTIARSYLKK